MKNLMTITLISLMVVSCSTMSKDAKNLMEKGDFTNAVALWDKVLKQDPNDEEAIRLRKIAQGEMMNIDLVTLKSLLDSHQTYAAFEHLRKLNDYRKANNLGISQNSAHYLRQQTERLYGQYLALIIQEIEAEHPLKAKFIDLYYRDLLPIEKTAEEVASKVQIQKIGSAQCDLLDANSKNNDYLRLYGISFCKVFGKTIALSKINQNRLKNKLTQLPVFTSNIEGLTDQDQRLVQHSLFETFSKIPGFSARGTQESVVQLVGNFSQMQNSSPVALSHSYTVQIPYTAYVTVTNKRSHPYTDSEFRCDSTGGNCHNESVTKYHEVDESETLTETKYREEPRVYTYTGTELVQKIAFSLQTKLKSSFLSLALPFQDRFDERLLTHNENLPAIGLTAKPGTLKTKEQWLKEELPKLTSSIEQQLQENFIKKHCAVKSKLTKWQIADHVFDCFQSKRAQSEALVKNWFIAETGLTPEDALEIIGPIGYF